VKIQGIQAKGPNMPQPTVKFSALGLSRKEADPIAGNSLIQMYTVSGSKSLSRRISARRLQFSDQAFISKKPSRIPKSPFIWAVCIHEYIEHGLIFTLYMNSCFGHRNLF
jgi:hypothetical protein